MNRKNEYAIKLWLEEIKYDVKFDSWRKENLLNAENENKGGKTELDVGYTNDKADDWLVRQIEDAIGNIYGELAWCAVDDGRMDSDEIEEDTPKEWTIVLRFSPNWTGSIRSMKSWAHRYVVNYVLSKWYRAGNIGGAEIYDAEAEKAIGELYNTARSEKVCLEPWTL